MTSIIQYAPTQMRDKSMIRLINRATRQYLHLSGEGETPDIKLSWLGTREQFKKLRRRARAAGKPWPYRVSKR